MPDCFQRALQTRRPFLFGPALFSPSGQGWNLYLPGMFLNAPGYFHTPANHFRTDHLELKGARGQFGGSSEYFRDSRLMLRSTREQFRSTREYFKGSRLRFRGTNEQFGSTRLHV